MLRIRVVVPVMCVVVLAIMAPAALAAVFNGDKGNDTYTGTDGPDVIHGKAGNDTLSGGRGNDRMWGEQGSDMLSGGDDSDQLRGGPGADTVDGGEGVDRIWVDLGADTVDAGAGNDTIFVRGSLISLRSFIKEGSIDCGTGQDTVYISMSALRRLQSLGVIGSAGRIRNCEVVRKDWKPVTPLPVRV